MIIMHLELDNLFGFTDFKVNFSYSKKLVQTTIEDEYLPTKPNFRYKKVNILMGANASGKTSLGKALRDIFNFIAKGKLEAFEDDISDQKKPAFFSIDFLVDEQYLYRVVCRMSQKEIFSLQIYRSKIAKSDSYESCIKKFKLTHADTDQDHIQKLSALPEIGWMFIFPKDDAHIYRIEESEYILGFDILRAVLKTLDSSIQDVVKSSEVEDSYIIKSKNGDIFVQNGEIVKKNILSTGTRAGIDIAHFISALCGNSYKFYYCDEQFSFIQSDVELALLSLMISLLKPNTQLFFTTHNLDILDMNIPIHSFMFLKKEDTIQVVHPEEKIKKNDVSLKNAVKNDVFDISPDITKILAIEDLLSEQHHAEE